MSTSSRNSDSGRRSTTDASPKTPGAAVSRSSPPGFGSYHYDPRYEELFKDDDEYSPNFNNAYAERDPSSRFQEPFGPDFSTTPFKKTVIILEQSQAGIRIFVQANPKAFLVLLAIAVIILSLPGIGDVVQGLVKSVVGMH